jgi:ubiquinone/menaquinone biosynthesis C-methylase UbiE
MNYNLIKKYDEASEWYEQKYVEGGWENNPYMKDEYDAHKFWMANGEVGKIISLGVGSGQDIEILGKPDPKTFVGYDISAGMLANARKKFPDYTFKLFDCKQAIDDKCDILVSMFGTPNYIGLSVLLGHYQRFNAKHAFFVFYDENYDDGFGEYYHKYTREELNNLLKPFSPIIEKLNENYYIVKW